MLDPAPSFYRQLIKKYNTTIDDISRLSEVIFGVIMVLTFTCAMSVMEITRQEVNATLWAALGCNTAWGIVDGLFFLMNTLYERGSKLQLLKNLHNTTTKDKATKILRDNLPPLFNELMVNHQIEELAQALKKLPEPPRHVFFTGQDLINAVIVFFLVFLSTFPIVLPFVFIKDAHLALRVSNLVGLIIMFIAGRFIGKKAGYNPTLFGFLFSMLGAFIVSFTMFLGG